MSGPLLAPLLARHDAEVLEVVPHDVVVLVPGRHKHRTAVAHRRGSDKSGVHLAVLQPQAGKLQSFLLHVDDDLPGIDAVEVAIDPLRAVPDIGVVVLIVEDSLQGDVVVEVEAQAAEDRQQVVEAEVVNRRSRGLGVDLRSCFPVV